MLALDCSSLSIERGSFLGAHRNTESSSSSSPDVSGVGSTTFGLAAGFGACFGFGVGSTTTVFSVAARFAAFAASMRALNAAFSSGVFSVTLHILDAIKARFVEYPNLKRLTVHGHRTAVVAIEIELTVAITTHLGDAFSDEFAVDLDVMERANDLADGLTHCR